MSVGLKPLRGLLALLPCFCILDNAAAETLGDVLADAYQGNAEIQAERYSLRSTDEQVPQALSGWRPTVQIQAYAYRQHQYFTFVPPPTETFNDTRASLQITQPIWRGGSNEANLKRAEAAVSAGRSQLNSVEQARLLDAARTYLDVYRDQNVVELNRNLEQVLSVNAQNVQATFNAGAATETDVAQANARLSGAVAGRLGAESALAASSAAFNRAVGRPPKQLDTPKTIGRLPQALDEAIATGVVSNPRIAAAHQRIEASQHQVDVLRGELLPRIDAVGSLDHENGLFARRDQINDERIGITASIPLYEAGDTYSRIRAAREDIQVDERQATEAEREVREDVTAAWTALDAARAQQRNFNEQIRANDIALRDTEKEVTVGTRTRLDTLNAQQELFGSKVNLVSAEHDTLLATFRLEEAMGQFTPQALGLHVSPYDPAAHLEAVRGMWIGTQPPE